MADLASFSPAPDCLLVKDPGDSAVPSSPFIWFANRACCPPARSSPLRGKAMPMLGKKSGTKAAPYSTKVNFRPPGRARVTSRQVDPCPSELADWRSATGRFFLNSGHLLTPRLDAKPFSAGLIGGATLRTKLGAQTAASSTQVYFRPQSRAQVTSRQVDPCHSEWEDWRRTGRCLLGAHHLWTSWQNTNHFSTD